jgi:hypothetical protein
MLSLQADKWDPELLYRDIMDIDIQHTQKFSLASETKESSDRMPLHPRLACIIEETVKLRKNNEYIRKISDDQLAVWFIYSDNPISMLQTYCLLLLQPCANCANKPESQKCVRTWEVEEHPDPDSLLGSIITCAEDHNILMSKVWFFEPAHVQKAFLHLYS